jgi:hypothetical protein
MRLEIVDRVEPEDATLATRIGGLQHRREADGLHGRVRLVQRPRRRKARLRHAGLGKATSHRHLVSHQVSRFRADAREAERLRDRGDHRNGAVGRDRQHTIDRVAAPNLGNRGDVHEVDYFADVGLAEPQSLRVPVDRDHAQPELLRSPDRAPLMPAGADEEDCSIQQRPMLTIKSSQLDSPPWR